MTKKFVLYEHALGYALLKVKAADVDGIVELAKQILDDEATFLQSFKLHAFSPFSSSAGALQNCNAISEGVLHEELKSFLKDNLPTQGAILLCLAERKLHDAIQSPESELPELLSCSSESVLAEVYRTLRLHFPVYIKDLSHFVEAKAQIGLGHSYSRAKVKYNVNRHKIVALVERRKQLQEYLATKLHGVAPNLSTVIGDRVCARLISHAGSLTNLAKFPASTIQILGAEKALFRALRRRGNTPKYGLIYHCPFIGQAARENKGRISRFIAAKCAIASRVDCFSENLTDIYGQHLKKQIEDRLKFFETGEVAPTNAEAMAIANAAVHKYIRKMKKKAIKTLQQRSPSPECGTPQQDVEITPTLKKKKKIKQEVKEELLESPHVNGDGEDAISEKKKTPKRRRSESVRFKSDELPETPEPSIKVKRKRSMSESSILASDSSAVETPKKKRKSKNRELETNTKFQMYRRMESGREMTETREHMLNSQASSYRTTKNWMEIARSKSDELPETPEPSIKVKRKRSMSESSILASDSSAVETPKKKRKSKNRELETNTKFQMYRRMESGREMTETREHMLNSQASSYRTTKNWMEIARSKSDELPETPEPSIKVKRKRSMSESSILASDSSAVETPKKKRKSKV